MSAPVIAVLMEEDERNTLEAFRNAGATTADRARSPSDLDLEPHSAAIRRFVRDGVLRRAGLGAYYLDEAALSDRRRRASGPLLLVIAGLVAGALLGGRSGR